MTERQHRSALRDDPGVVPDDPAAARRRLLARRLLAQRAAPRPLSPAQRALWLAATTAGSDLVYGIVFSLELPVDVDVDRLRVALGHVVERHPVLRSRLVPDPDGDGVLQADDGALPRWRHSDLRGRVDVAAALAAAGRELADDPVDLEVGPVLRIHVLGADDATHLLVSVHHLVFDGASIPVLLDDWRRAYEAGGRAERPAATTRTFGDVSREQHEQLVSGGLDRHLDLASARLADVGGIVDIPTDHRRPDTPDGRGAALSVPLDPAVVEAVRDVARRTRTTPFMVLHAIFATLLARLSGQAEVTVGVPVAGRTRPGSAELVGMFVNTVVLRTRLEATVTLEELLERTRPDVLDAFGLQDVPVDALVDRVAPRRPGDRLPLFQHLFGVDDRDARGPGGAFGNAVVRELPTGTAKCDLSVRVVLDDEPRIEMEYATALWHESGALTFAGRLARLTAAATAATDRPLAHLDLLDDEERATVVELPDPCEIQPDTATVADLLEAQAARTPDRPAVTHGDRVLSYADLGAHANRVAHRLRALGVDRGELVAVCAPRSIELVVALHGVARAGGGVLSLDPEHPAERLALVCEDSEASVLLVAEELAHRVPTGPGAPRVVLLEEALAGGREDDLERTAGSGDVVYALYTSGSTGRPKGVLNEHRGLVNRLRWMQEAYPLDSSDVVLQKTPATFDVSMWEFFWPLLVGARLAVAAPDEHRDPFGLAARIRDEQVTVLHFVPSMLAAFLESGAATGLDTVRHVVCSGEKLSADLARRCLTTILARLHNLYGPTEAAIDVSAWECTPGRLADGADTSIGTSIAGIRLVVLDRFGEPCPVGVTGRLHIGGVGLARGYLARARLTAERFVPDPAGHGRLYDTGDLARRRADGTLDYLGREDGQVKLGGVRVELGEVEATLVRHEAVAAAAVSVHADRLVAHVVPDATAARPVRRAAEMQVDGRLDGLLVHRLPDGRVHLVEDRRTADLVAAEIDELADSGLLDGLGDGACVVDVGAHIGLFGHALAARVPAVRLVGVEPIPATARVLRLNAELHGWDLRVVEAGLAECRGTAEFHHYPGASILSGRWADAEVERAVVGRFVHNLLEDEGGATSPATVRDGLEERLRSVPVDVALTTLSDVLHDHGVEQVDLLRIDAEKSELAVLQGLREEDWPRIRRVVAEVHDEDGRLEDFLALLERHGLPTQVSIARGFAGTGLVIVTARRPGDPERATGSVAPPRFPLAEDLAEQLRADLGTVLPATLVPHQVLVTHALPLTSSGKLDRGALPDPAGTRSSSRAPSGPLECLVAAAFRAVLGLEAVGADDDFFDLGGRSMVGIRLAARLSAALGRQVGLPDVLAAPTVAALAERCARGATVGDGSPVLTLRTGGTRTPWFCLPPVTGLSWGYTALVDALDALDADHPVLALQPPGLQEGTEVPTTVEGLVENYSSWIGTLQPDGPVLLVGWSAGGRIAHELAAHLETAGRRVDALVLLDAYPGEVQGTEQVDEERVCQEVWRALGPGDVDRPVPRDLAELTGRWSELGPDPAALTRIAAVVEAHLRALDGRTTPSVAVRVDHVRARRSDFGGAFRGEAWAPYSSGVDLHLVDADHWGLLRGAADAVAHVLLGAAGPVRTDGES